MIARECRKRNFDALWLPSHRFIPVVIPSKTKCVVTIHDLVWRICPKTMRMTGLLMDMLTMPIAVKNSDVVLAVSKNTASDLTRLMKVSPDKISVTQLGVRTLSKKKTHPLLTKTENGKAFLLTVGTIEPRKNHHRLIRAYSQLDCNIKKSMDLIIVGGSGWGNVQLSKLINSYGLSENVQIRNYTTSDELDWLYRNATMFIYPSLYEGFGLPVAEAMSYGLPVISSNNSSIPEVLGGSGVLIDPLNTSSIAAAISKLYKDESLRCCLSKRATDRASIFFI